MKTGHHFLYAIIILFSSEILSTEFQWPEDLQKFNVDFDISMGFDKKDRYEKRRRKRRHKEMVKFCHSLYLKNNLTKIQPLEHTIIPKIIHIIWVGPNTPPPVFNRCLESIKTHLPSWELKVWTDKDLPNLTLENQKYYDEETNYGAKADLLRYELLYQFGGVYLDVDFVLCQPLDVLNHSYEFYTSLMPCSSLTKITNAVIGSVPGHPILKHCISAIKDYRHRSWIVKRTGPILFQKSFYSVAKNLPDSRVIALPATFFFPLEMHDTQKTIKNIAPETFGIHYWTASWDKKKWRARRNNGS